MTVGKLTIYFEDGSTEEILMKNILELGIPSKSLEFRQDKKGEWLTVVTKDFLNGRKLAKNRLLELDRIEK